MNQVTKTAVSGIAVAALCAGLAAIPNLFNALDDKYNERLALVWFLSLSLPGLVISLLVGLIAKQLVERHAMILTWCAAAVFAVALPTPAILLGQWDDGLIGIYILLALVAGSVWRWISLRRADRTQDAQQAGASNGG